MRQFTAPEIINAFRKKGYVLSEIPFAVNIFGVRLSNDEANTFNDCVGLLWKDGNGNYIIKQYQATTDPGTYYRLHPLNVGGCAVIVPNQYKSVYKLGIHKDYPAMQQVGNMTYIRDNSKSGLIHWYYKIAGQYKPSVANNATNIHHAYKVGTTKNVDNWSAGCQVFGNIDEWNEFLNLVKHNVEEYKFVNSFNYTLFESEDIT